MKLLEQDYFVLRFGSGLYATPREPYKEATIEAAVQIHQIDNAIWLRNYLKDNGRDCEIVPVKETIIERKKRELLCYLENPLVGNGWLFHTDDTMKLYWSFCQTKGFAALTD